MVAYQMGSNRHQTPTVLDRSLTVQFVIRCELNGGASNNLPAARICDQNLRQGGTGTGLAASALTPRSIAIYSSVCCTTLHGTHSLQVRVFIPAAL